MQHVVFQDSPDDAYIPAPVLPPSKQLQKQRKANEADAVKPAVKMTKPSEVKKESLAAFDFDETDTCGDIEKEPDVQEDKKAQHNGKSTRSRKNAPKGNKKKEPATEKEGIWTAKSKRTMSKTKSDSVSN